jgi:hypothetical protein
MSDERMIAYLLAELPEADLERFEDECFAQESWPDRISVAEDDLIDAYLRDELTPERRQRFERNYLITSARQERVNMAAALLRLIDEHNDAATKVTPTWVGRFSVLLSNQTPALWAAAALALAAVMGAVLWLAFLRGPTLHGYATLTLTVSRGSRGEGAQVGRVKLPVNAQGLKVTLSLPQQGPAPVRYRVELENDNGEAKLVEVADQDAQSVVAVIPASQLPRGQYALKLFAVKGDGSEQRVTGSYLFTVE